MTLLRKPTKQQTNKKREKTLSSESPATAKHEGVEDQGEDRLLKSSGLRSRDVHMGNVVSAALGL